jgi:lipoate-protein ligase A
LLEFRGSGQAPATPLNAEEEARRLENEETIRRATGGGQVVIERDRGGFKLPGT